MVKCDTASSLLCVQSDWIYLTFSYYRFGRWQQKQKICGIKRNTANGWRKYDNGWHIDIGICELHCYELRLNMFCVSHVSKSHVSCTPNWSIGSFFFLCICLCIYWNSVYTQCTLDTQQSTPKGVKQIHYTHTQSHTIDCIVYLSRLRMFKYLNMIVARCCVAISSS